MIKMKYSEVTAFPFRQTVAKIGHEPINDISRLSRIKRLISEINIASETISAAYKKELIEKFAKRDEKNGIVFDTNADEGFILDDTREEEYKKERAEFGDRIMHFKNRPWDYSTLNGIKLAAADINNLGPCFHDDAPEGEESEKPAVPTLHSIK